MGTPLMTPTPEALITPLWRSDSATVTLSLKDWKRVLLHYGTSLHMRNGRGYELAGKRIGPGVYEVRLKEKVYV